MKKNILTLCALLFSLPAIAKEPARRPQGPAPTMINGKALCRDSQFDCMYTCEIKKGTVCMPTRNSDPNCPAQQISGGNWFSDKLVGLEFTSRKYMSCAVTALPRTNHVCGDTKFGWDCWVGKMHVMEPSMRHLALEY
jgi:hypothetical protein